MRCPRRPHLALRALTTLVVALVLGRSSPAHAQDVDSNIWVPNGEVDAVAVSGNTLYIGGQFSRLGPASGCAAPIDPATGLLLADFPKVDGYVYAVAAGRKRGEGRDRGRGHLRDGWGGWNP